MASTTRGIVLFVDDARWTSFDHFAAGLRRRSYRSVRITTQTGGLSRLVSRLFYDGHVVANDLDDLRAVWTAADLSRIVDVQCPETLLEGVCAALDSSTLPDQVRSRLAWKRGHLDKFEMSRTLRRQGVRVPRTQSGTVPADQALAVLGTPLVVKGRIGHGGIAVAVVRTAAEAASAVDDLGGSDQVYFEEWIDGDLMKYVACRADGHTLVEATYVGTRPGRGSLGSSTGIELVDDPDLAALGRSTLDAIQGDGPANIEVVRRRDGLRFVIDVNLRISGSAATLQAAGLDLIDTYVESIGGPPRADRPTASHRRRLAVFPDASIALVRRGELVRGCAEFLDGAAMYTRYFGLRYLLGAALLLGAAVRELPRRSPASVGSVPATAKGR